MSKTALEWKIWLLHKRAFKPELQERGDGWAVMLPIDGNYYDLEIAQIMLEHFQVLARQIADELGHKTKVLTRLPEIQSTDNATD